MKHLLNAIKTAWVFGRFSYYTKCKIGIRASRVAGGILVEAITFDRDEGLVKLDNPCYGYDYSPDVSDGSEHFIN